ncbi:MAG TPA: hypothetical protein VGJ15_08565 [Pirellulales bacterium]|jgi:hypothetical protein
MKFNRSLSSGNRRAAAWALSFTTALFVCCIGFSSSAFAITLGQVNDFQDGALSGWTGGGGTMMSVPSAQIITGGGPAGVGDNYMLISSGSTSGNRLLTVGSSQWIGNFSAAGVNAVAVDLLNPSTIDLSMRAAIREGTQSSAPGYVSSVAFNLPADNLWHHFVFPIDAADMTGINGSGSPAPVPQPFATDIGNVVEFRILDAKTPMLMGEPFSSTTTPTSASFGIDNITAVPEPGGIVLLAFGALLLTIGATKIRVQHARLE